MARRGRVCRHNQWVDVLYEIGFGAQTIDLICLDNHCLDFFSQVTIGDVIKLELANGREIAITVEETEGLSPSVCRAAIKVQRVRLFP